MRSQSKTKQEGQSLKSNQMDSWWDSLGILQSYNNRLLLWLAVFGVINAGLIMLSVKWTERISYLQDKFSREETERADGRISKAELDVAASNAAAAEANKIAAEANERAARLEKEAAAMRLENTRLKFRRGEPLSELDSRDLVKLLGNSVSGTKIFICRTGVSSSSLETAHNLIRALKEAGASVHPVLEPITSVPQTRGLRVESGPSGLEKSWAVKEAFQRMGWAMFIGKNAKLQDNELSILVGDLSETE